MVLQSGNFNLEERLINFASDIIDLVEILPNTRAGNHIAGQLLRCGTSPAPNYGEAQSAESRADFIHKMNVCLKELRETSVWLKMMDRRPKMAPASKVKPLLRECEELIRIFVKSINTAKINRIKEKGKDK